MINGSANTSYVRTVFNGLVDCIVSIRSSLEAMYLFGNFSIWDLMLSVLFICLFIAFFLPILRSEIE